MNGKENIKRYIEAHKTLDKLYDRKNHGAVELSDDSMITIDVEDGKITITKYKDNFAWEYTEPKDIDEACQHIKHYLEFDELPNGEAI